MSTRPYTVFDRASGSIVGIRYTSKSIAEIALIAGQGVIEGAFDALSYRIDPGTLVPVDYQPPRPGQEYFWDTQTRRWQIDPVIAHDRERVVQLTQSIKDLDLRLIRPACELLDNPDDAAAREIYSKLKEEKAKLRAELQGLTGK